MVDFAILISNESLQIHCITSVTARSKFFGAKNFHNASVFQQTKHVKFCNWFILSKLTLNFSIQILRISYKSFDNTEHTFLFLLNQLSFNKKLSQKLSAFINVNILYFKNLIDKWNTAYGKTWISVKILLRRLEVTEVNVWNGKCMQFEHFHTYMHALISKIKYYVMSYSILQDICASMYRIA